MTVYSATSYTSRKKKDTIEAARAASGNSNMETNTQKLNQNQFLPTSSASSLKNKNSENNGHSTREREKQRNNEGDQVSERAPLLQFPTRFSPLKQERKPPSQQRPPQSPQTKGGGDVVGGSEKPPFIPLPPRFSPMQQQRKSNGNRQQKPQSPQKRGLLEGSDGSEKAPRLQFPRRFSPLQQQRKNAHVDNQEREQQHHNRTRSVDATGPYAFATAPPPPPPSAPTTEMTPRTAARKAAPGRDHHRTRSLEEWASLFGIKGITDANKDAELGGTQDRELYQSRNQRFLNNGEDNQNASGTTNKSPLPPRAPSSYYSPSSVKSRNIFLDSIVEVEQPSDENDSDEHVVGDIQGDKQAQADHDYDYYSSNSRGNIESPPKQDYPRTAFAAGDSFNSSDSNNYYHDDNQRIGSNCTGSPIFSIPQYLTNSGTYSSSAMDDSSVDDNSTSAGSLLSHGRSGSYDFATTERLARFEREQEMLFQQKKANMERDLSNVLERGAVKTHRERQEFINAYMTEMERERATLVAQWRKEWEKEAEYLRQRDPKRQLLRDLYDKIGRILDALMYFFSSAEVFISNMPLTIAAFALSWVSMGCVWFKWMEENVDSCHSVHFYSPQCTFPEFPGCFECDLENKWYIIGVNWHYFCSTVSFIFCSMIMLKVIIAWDVVVDELGNPTTSTPCGVFCIAMVCVFAGRGPVGEMVVLITATFHFLLAFWFLYMAIYRYRLFPDPGWFPNTVGISYAAVKSFLYFPLYSAILMTVCLAFFVGVFFISAIRVATNHKIAAPICWFMISAPSITLYAVTLISQPLAQEEEAMQKNPELKAHFLHFLRMYYLPLHHFLFACSLLGVFSAVHGVYTRWEKFKEIPFSPAHAAFVSPTLAHANAIQAYRATIASLSSFPPGGWFCTSIYIWWCIFLFTGTAVNFIFTYKFLRRLPEWTKVDVADEEAPPAPYETMTHEMLDDRGAHESMFQQTFVSPAVLEANEAGALIRVRRGTEDYRRYGPFIRTRRVTARGFDPSMNDDELREERAALLDWVAKHAPRKRNRTMSISWGDLRDKSGRGVYGTFWGDLIGNNDPNDGNAGDQSRPSKHGRSKTSVEGFW